MRLARVGYENVTGMLGRGARDVGAPPGCRAASTRVEPVTEAVRPGRRVLDVRRGHEWESGPHRGRDARAAGPAARGSRAAGS